MSVYIFLAQGLWWPKQDKGVASLMKLFPISEWVWVSAFLKDTVTHTPPPPIFMGCLSLLTSICCSHPPFSLTPLPSSSEKPCGVFTCAKHRTRRQGHKHVRKVPATRSAQFSRGAEHTATVPGDKGQQEGLQKCSQNNTEGRKRGGKRCVGRYRAAEAPTLSLNLYVQSRQGLGRTGCPREPEQDLRRPGSKSTWTSWEAPRIGCSLYMRTQRGLMWAGPVLWRPFYTTEHLHLILESTHIHIHIFT